MGIFSGLFGDQKQTPIEKLKTEIEKAYEIVAQKSMRENPDPMLGATQSYYAIIEAGKIFKRDFGKLAKHGQLTEQEINNAVDEVQYRILNKYFEDFE